MSWNLDAKKEIINNRSFRTRYKNQLTYGLLLFSRAFSPDEVSLTTTQRVIADYYAQAIASIIRLNGGIFTTQEQRGEKTYYHVVLDTQRDRWELFNYFAMLYPEGVTYDLLGGDAEAGAFVGGAFLACGNLTDPEIKYHMEFAIPRSEICDTLTTILREVGFEPGITVRRDLPLVYSHDSAQMEDLLTFIGCPLASMELMNVKIVKERRNAANRAMNCDFANINKVVSAAAAQLEAIRLVGIENMPEELRTLARLRMEFPDDSLRELGARLDPPLSRSGVNHRMEKIFALAKSTVGVTEGE